MKSSYTVPQSPQSLSPVDSYNVWPGGAFPLNKVGGRRRTGVSRKRRKGKKRTRKANRKVACKANRKVSRKANRK
jgi:hypothetical protein